MTATTQILTEFWETPAGWTKPPVDEEGDCLWQTEAWQATGTHYTFPFSHTRWQQNTHDKNTQSDLLYGGQTLQMRAVLVLLQGCCLQHEVLLLSCIHLMQVLSCHALRSVDGVLDHLFDHIMKTLRASRQHWKHYYYFLIFILFVYSAKNDNIIIFIYYYYFMFLLLSAKII